MAVRFSTTDEEAKTSGRKILVYGGSGAGKTTLFGTIEDSLAIISAEAGMLSLGKKKIPVMTVETIDDLRDIAGWFKNKAKGFEHFQWLGLDSVSEIAEKILANEKAIAKDPRKAYGEMQDQLWEIVRLFRDLPIDVVFTAKQERIDTGSGLIFGPMMPGKNASQNIDYYFDEVFALRVEKDPADSTKSIRALQTGRDYQYSAKDRSGALAMFEPPNLQAIKNKILAHLGQQA